MNRSDCLLLSLGGGGNRLTDTILSYDPRFIGAFVNTSITDLESLDNFDEVIKNYFCISQQNGVGRNRSVGKRYAIKNGYNIIEMIQKYQQEVVYLIATFGGGSGSSILSVLLTAIKQLKDDGDFNKTINLICILPDLDSPDIILKNALDTWNEIITNDCINSMIFIDNSTKLDKSLSSEENEKLINEEFAKLFDSVFDIPATNGIKFDNGNLSNVLNDKGCLYIYDLPSGMTSVDQALIKAEKNSVIAKMYKTSKNIETDENGNEKVICGYLGTSFNDENYNQEDVLNHYSNSKEYYTGYNGDEHNLLLVSGCYPPYYIVQVIEAELEDRMSKKVNRVNDFSDFVVNVNADVEKKKVINEPQQEQKKSAGRNKTMKKVMKKNLFTLD